MKKTAEGTTTYSRRDALKIGAFTLGNLALVACGAQQAQVDKQGVTIAEQDKTIKALGDSAAEQSRKFDALAKSLTDVPSTAAPTRAPEATAETEVVVNGATLEKGLVLPENYPTTPKDASTEFGGKAEYWKMDTYTIINGQRYNIVDDKAYGSDGKEYVGSEKFKAMWGGAWTAEALPLRTDGIRNTDGTLYNHNVIPEYFQLTLGKAEKQGTASATWWNGKTKTYGSGAHSLGQGQFVEQAVIWPVAESDVCKTPEQQQVLASKHAMETLFKFLTTDKNASKLNVMTWDPVKGEYKTYKPGELVTDIEFDMKNIPAEGYPLNANDAVHMGGTAQGWSQDLYNDPTTGKVTWGFTWNFEGHKLLTPFKSSGAYIDQNGKIMPITSIFDTKGTATKSVIKIDDQAMRITYWDGGENTYGAGGGTVETPYPVEQAVVKPSLPANGCFEADGSNPQLLPDGVGADIRQFAQTDKNVDKVNVAIWNGQTWQKFAPGQIVNSMPSWLR